MTLGRGGFIVGVPELFGSPAYQKAIRFCHKRQVIIISERREFFTLGDQNSNLPEGKDSDKS
jgi:hypothetical protein